MLLPLMNDHIDLFFLVLHSKDPKRHTTRNAEIQVVPQELYFSPILFQTEMFVLLFVLPHAKGIHKHITQAFLLLVHQTALLNFLIYRTLY
jgi:hypothetical protein